MRVCLGPLVVVVLAAPACSEKRAAFPKLVLAEQATFPLPESLSVRSARLNENGDLLVLSQHGRVFRIRPKDGDVHPVSCGSGEWVAARSVANPGERIEGLVAHPFGKRTCTGGTAQDIPLDSIGEVLQAGWDGVRWVWAVHLPERRMAIVGEAVGGNTARRLDTLWTVADLKPGQDIYLHSSPNTILFGEFRSPFRVWVVRNAQALLRLDPPAALRDSLGGPDTLRWVSLSTHALDSGYVQHFADLNGDERILMLYALDGRAIRSLRVDAPFGLLANDPVRRELLAYRRINRPELVVYRWRWVPVSDTLSQP
jgi:hypothetical protein